MVLDFRTGRLVDCGPAEEEELISPPRQEHSYDFMAKEEYDSFLRATVKLLASRVPGWREPPEGDSGVALLQLFAYLGDQLAYYEDRVANESFLSTAKQYESVRRLLRAVDHGINPGAAARVQLAFTVRNPKFLTAGSEVMAALPGRDGDPVVFLTDERRTLYPELNEVSLDADAPVNPECDRIVLAAALEGMLVPGDWLLVEAGEEREWARVSEPVTVDAAAGTTSVRLGAPLRGRFPTPSGRVRGNGAAASHGTPRVQRSQGTGVANQVLGLEFTPLTYLEDLRGNLNSTLAVTVKGERWNEVEDLGESSPRDRHYHVSRDNEGAATVRFGDGRQGRTPPAGASIKARYRSGAGHSGLVAANTLRRLTDPEGDVIAVTNPLPSHGAAIKHIRTMVLLTLALGFCDGLPPEGTSSESLP